MNRKVVYTLYTSCMVKCDAVRVVEFTSTVCLPDGTDTKSKVTAAGYVRVLKPFSIYCAWFVWMGRRAAAVGAVIRYRWIYSSVVYQTICFRCWNCIAFASACAGHETRSLFAELFRSLIFLRCFWSAKNRKRETVILTMHLTIEIHLCAFGSPYGVCCALLQCRSDTTTHMHSTAHKARIHVGKKPRFKERYHPFLQSVCNIAV